MYAPGVSMLRGWCTQEQFDVSRWPRSEGEGQEFAFLYHKTNANKVQYTTIHGHEANQTRILNVIALLFLCSLLSRGNRHLRWSVGDFHLS